MNGQRSHVLPFLFNTVVWNWL